MRLFRTRKSRRPAIPPVSHRISTLSNATTLHPVQNAADPSSFPPSALPPSLLSSFPAPPSAASPLPIQSNLPPNASSYPYTFLPNISQASLETLADPLGRLPNAPNRLSTYEAFIRSAREAEIRRMETEQRMVRAWARAEEERRYVAMQQSRSWPHDPWRGGFGPPSSSVGRDAGLGIGMNVGGNFPSRRERGEPQRPKSGGSGVQGVKVWLKRVTSLERLRA